MISIYYEKHQQVPFATQRVGTYRAHCKVEKSYRLCTWDLTFFGVTWSQAIQSNLFYKFSEKREDFLSDVFRTSLRMRVEELDYAIHCFARVRFLSFSCWDISHGDHSPPSKQIPHSTICKGFLKILCRVNITKSFKYCFTAVSQCEHNWSHIMIRLLLKVRPIYV